MTTVSPKPGGVESERGAQGSPCRPRGLILVATRELAEQTYETLVKLCYRSGIVPGPAFSGGDTRTQRMYLRLHQCEVVVSTPERLLSHLKRGTVKLEHCVTLILDEFDELMRPGVHTRYCI